MTNRFRERIEKFRIRNKIDKIRMIDNMPISNEAKIRKIEKLKIPKFTKERLISHYRRQQAIDRGDKLFRKEFTGGDSE